MAEKIGGRAEVRINGIQYPLRGDVVIMSGTVTRTSISGADGYHGVTETSTPAWAEFTLSDLPSVNISAIQDLTDCTVNIKLDNQKQAVLHNAAQVNAIELNQTDGQYTVKFESPSCAWI